MSNYNDTLAHIVANDPVVATLFGATTTPKRRRQSTEPRLTMSRAFDLADLAAVYIQQTYGVNGDSGYIHRHLNDKQYGKHITYDVRGDNGKSYRLVVVNRTGKVIDITGH